MTSSYARKGAADNQDTQTTLSLPASLVSHARPVPGASRADGNVTSIGLFVIGKNNRVVGGQGAPGIGVNVNRRLGRPRRARPSRSSRALAPHGPGEVAIDAATVERAGYGLGERVHLVSAGRKALLRPRWWASPTSPRGARSTGRR